MNESNLYKDFSWKNQKPYSFNYLFKTIAHILSEFNFSKSISILDTACGNGYLVKELSESGYENIWGFDLSSSGIEIARSINKNLSNNLAIHDLYQKKLPNNFPASGYDLIFGAEVIEHLYSPSKYLENVNSWLKGVFILTTPYHGYLKNLAISIFNGFDKHFNPLQEGGHIKFFSKKTLYRLLQENGFNPIKLYGSGRLPYLWKSMVVVSEMLKNKL